MLDVVITASPGREATACSLADRLKLDYVGDRDTRTGNRLHVGIDRTELLIESDDGERALCVDYLAGSSGHRLKHLGRHEPLLRAVGARKGCTLSVLDGTPGLGFDAIMLALFGCQLTLVERSAPLVALLEDGLWRVLPQLERLAGGSLSVQVEFGDSRAWMNALTPDERPDVVYLDPMFPQRSKSALVKLEMRLLRSIAGEGPDSDALLEVALRTARNRVVVKRPKGAAPLNGTRPDHHVESPGLRFDVYMMSARERQPPPARYRPASA